MCMSKPKSLFVIGLLLLPVSLFAQDFKVLALFPGKAMLQVGNKQFVLTEGKAKKGFTLVKTDTYKQTADITINGVTETYTLGNHIGGGYSSPAAKEVRLVADSRGSYYTTGRINNQNVNFVVDTGATSVALSEARAQALGISYQNNQQGKARTASGEADAWRVILDSVSIGGITLNSVTGVVLKGNYPETTLLGMTFLKQLEISHEENLMVLKKKF